MSKFKIVAVPIALFIWIFTTLLFVNYSREVYVELQEYRLDIAVNYSIDAAIDAMLDDSTDLGLDYADFAYMSVDPTIALEEFCVMFAKNYGMALSVDNIALIKSDYLPVFCVADYDGFYVAQPTKINSSGAYDSIFSMKQPYTYKDASGDVYSLNLGYKQSKRYDGSTISIVDAPITEEEQKSIINAKVSDMLMSTVYKQKEGNVQSTIYIPSDMTNIVRTNPIESVTVLAYISNVSVGFSRELESFGIGGARVVHEQFVAGYEYNGRLLYSYVKDVPNTITVLEVFENPKLAAEHGYSFDYRYLK